MIINPFSPVGVTGFEPATTRPPDAYSNRAELHPELRMQRYGFILNLQIYGRFFSEKVQLFVAGPSKRGNRPLQAHAFPVEIERFEDGILVGRLVEADVTHILQQSKVDDAGRILLVVLHQFVEAVVM